MKEQSEMEPEGINSNCTSGRVHESEKQFNTENSGSSSVKEVTVGNFHLQIQEAISAAINEVSRKTEESEGVADNLNNCIFSSKSQEIFDNTQTRSNKDQLTFQNQVVQQKKTFETPFGDTINYVNNAVRKKDELQTQNEAEASSQIPEVVGASFSSEPKTINECKDLYLIDSAATNLSKHAPSSSSVDSRQVKPENKQEVRDNTTEDLSINSNLAKDLMDYPCSRSRDEGNISTGGKKDVQKADVIEKDLQAHELIRTNADISTSSSCTTGQELVNAMNKSEVQDSIKGNLEIQEIVDTFLNDTAQHMIETNLPVESESTRSLKNVTSSDITVGGENINTEDTVQDSIKESLQTQEVVEASISDVPKQILEKKIPIESDSVINSRNSDERNTSTIDQQEVQSTTVGNVQNQEVDKAYVSEKTVEKVLTVESVLLDSNNCTSVIDSMIAENINTKEQLEVKDVMEENLHIQGDSQKSFGIIPRKMIEQDLVEHNLINNASNCEFSTNTSTDTILTPNVMVEDPQEVHESNEENLKIHEVIQASLNDISNSIIVEQNLSLDLDPENCISSNDADITSENKWQDQDLIERNLQTPEIINDSISNVHKNIEKCLTIKSDLIDCSNSDTCNSHTVNDESQKIVNTEDKQENDGIIEFDDNLVMLEIVEASINDLPLKVIENDVSVDLEVLSTNSTVEGNVLTQAPTKSLNCQEIPETLNSNNVSTMPLVDEVFPVTENKDDADEQNSEDVQIIESIPEVIEIVSDEEVEEKSVQKMLETEQLIETDTRSTCKLNIFQEIKAMSSTELLLLYIKLSTKRSNNEDIPRQSSNSEDNQNVIQAKLKSPLKMNEIQQFVEITASETSRKLVENIIDKVKMLPIVDYMMLYKDLPKDCVKVNLRQLPKRSLNITQTVGWMKTHLEERTDQKLVKNYVFDKYSTYCNKNKIYSLTSATFGKLLKQVFPKMGQRRHRMKGVSLNYYVGLAECQQLKSPRLPKLSKKFQKLYQLPTSGDQELECLNENNAYRSSQIDGQTILVHDPLALLNISTKKVSSPVQSYEDISSVAKSGQLNKINKIAKSCLQFRNRPSCSSSSHRVAPVIKSSVHNVKFKEYKHPSVESVFKKFKTVLLPHEIFKLNISPRVMLNYDEMNKWYAEHFKNLIQRLSNIVITKIDSSTNVKVTCTCCDDVFEMPQDYEQQLSHLKEKLSNIVVRKSKYSSNYEVVCRTYTNALSKQLSDIPQCSGALRIIKQITSGSFISQNETKKSFNPLKNNQHPSVQKAFKKFKDLSIPAEIFKSDIDPVIVLNSGEVFDWYVEQLNNLKEKLSNINQIRGNKSSCNTGLQMNSPKLKARQTRAKMMNFYESSSSDCDSDDMSKDKLKSLKFMNKNNHNIVKSDVENATVSLAYSYGRVSVPETENIPMASNKMVNENVQHTDASQKRLRTNDGGDKCIEQKRAKFNYNEVIANPVHTEHSSEQCSVNNSPLQPENKSFICYFCADTYNNEKELTDHKKIHLRCRSCKKKLKSKNLMIQHLLQHCYRNSKQGKPFLKLHQIDTVPPVVKKHVFQTPISDVTQNLCIVEKMNLKLQIEKTATARKSTSKPYMTNAHHNHRTYFNKHSGNIKKIVQPMISQTGQDKMSTSNIKYTYTRRPRPAILRTLKSLEGSIPLQTATPVFSTATSESIQVNCQSQPQTAPQVNSSITNNLNTVLFESNNMSQSPTQSSGVVYGALCFNNLKEQSLQTLCLTNTNTTNNLPSTVYVNHSCVNPQFQQPTFMQIVETPRTSITEEHSYFQQKVVNNINNLNEVVFMSPISDNSTSVFPSFVEQPVRAETEVANCLLDERPSDSSNRPMQGQFKIRVKSLQELR